MNDKIGNNGFTIPDYLITPTLKLTDEGGIAVKLINKTGGVSVKGNVLAVDTITDYGVRLLPIDLPDPCGVMYESGIADGEEVWVVISGIADVLYSTAVGRGTFSRGPESGDVSKTAGKAIAEALPTPPFATDKHFQEIGHSLETIGAPGLARTVLHFN